MKERALTPPQWMEIHRYWAKVEQIKAHLRTAEGCACGLALATDDYWAVHLADVLFPHRGAHDGQ